MSDDANAYAAEIVAEFSSIFSNNAAGYASIAMVLYEDLITIGREVELFWGQRVTAATVLFLLNRVLAGTSLVLLELYTDTDNNGSGCDDGPFRCAQLVYAVDSTKLLLYFPWAAFSALRVLALTGGRRVLSVFVFLLSLVPLVINFVDFRWEVPYIDPFFGCGEGSSETVFISKLFTGLSRGSLILADLIVITVTWHATYKTTRLAHEVEGRLRSSSLSLVLLKDGTIYFVIIMIMNILHLMFSLGDVFTLYDSISDISIFLEPTESILISRFLMNLQEANMRLTNGASLDPSSFRDADRETSTIRFNTVLGSLGNSLFSDEHEATDSSDTSMQHCAGDVRLVELI